MTGRASGAAVGMTRVGFGAGVAVGGNAVGDGATVGCGAGAAVGDGVCAPQAAIRKTSAAQRHTFFNALWVIIVSFAVHANGYGILGGGKFIAGGATATWMGCPVIQPENAAMLYAPLTSMRCKLYKSLGFCCQCETTPTA